MEENERRAVHALRNEKLEKQKEERRLKVQLRLEKRDQERMVKQSQWQAER